MDKELLDELLANTKAAALEAAALKKADARHKAMHEGVKSSAERMRRMQDD